MRPVNNTARVFIGLGSNLGDRRQTILQAMELLNLTAGIRVKKLSSFLETEPEGMTGPTFLNGVAELDTNLEPRPLLDRLLDVEHRLGRPRPGNPGRTGPRTLDLDLLIYGDRQIDEPDLQVPHPRIRERNFVLTPLSEIAPDIAERLHRKENEG